MDKGGLRKMLLTFERKINKNQLLRAKHADDPSKYGTASPCCFCQHY